MKLYIFCFVISLVSVNFGMERKPGHFSYDDYLLFAISDDLVRTSKVILLAQKIEPYELIQSQFIEKPSHITSIDKFDIIKLFIEKGSQASETGRLDLVKFLIEKGARVNQSPSRLSPFIMALEKGYSDIAAYLLVHDADTTRLKDLKENYINIKPLIIETLQKAVISIIVGSFFNKLEQQSLLALCLIREYCDDSPFGKDYLPLDMFKEIKKRAEALSLSVWQTLELISFFREIGCEHSDPDFMQKLEQYKGL
ncbi:MAG: hypothetical protein AB7R69_00510 [Candidatus Babeliales bacterium]